MPNESSASDRALRWVGDLDHPFYDDERQRFVWYESSAIGFQLMFLLQYLVAAIVLLVVGAPALPYLLAMVGPVAFTGIVVASYAQRRGAQYFPSIKDFSRSRGLVFLGILVLLIAGTFRAVPSGDAEMGSGSGAEGFWGGFQSAVTGPWLAVAMLCGLLFGLFVSMRSKADDSDLDDLHDLD